MASPKHVSKRNYFTKTMTCGRDPAQLCARHTWQWLRMCWEFMEQREGKPCPFKRLWVSALCVTMLNFHLLHRPAGFLSLLCANKHQASHPAANPGLPFFSQAPGSLVRLRGWLLSGLEHAVAAKGAGSTLQQRGAGSGIQSLGYKIQIEVNHIRKTQASTWQRRRFAHQDQALTG